MPFLTYGSGFLSVWRSHDADGVAVGYPTAQDSELSLTREEVVDDVVGMVVGSTHGSTRLSSRLPCLGVSTAHRPDVCCDLVRPLELNAGQAE